MVNKLILDNKNKDTYKLIMKISITNKEYIIYTKDEENKLGDKICYVSHYEIQDGVQRISSISKEELENIDEVFSKVIRLLYEKENKSI